MSSKLREVLLKAEVLISIATFEEGVKMDEVDKIRSEIKAALAEPLRNCDVGTADEQSDRFLDLCESHSVCSQCPVKSLWNFADGHRPSCGVLWSQMPYESEVRDIDEVIADIRESEVK